MIRMRWRYRFAWLPVLLALFTLSARAETVVRVFAAASLKESFEEIGRAYEAKHPGARIEFEFAGSQILRTQIEQGAPADVFASADTVQMDPLVKRGLVGMPAVFARNRLVVVAPLASKVRTLKDLALPGMKIVLAETSVPAGRYALQSITRMGRPSEYGPSFAARLFSNVASRETSVRAVLAKVTLGEADAGFVYATDALAAGGKAQVVGIPARFNVVAAYPIAVVSKTPTARQAADFVALVRSKAGRLVLQRHGFAP